MNHTVSGKNCKPKLGRGSKKSMFAPKSRHFEGAGRYFIGSLFV
jgi:hypothetical protein